MRFWCVSLCPSTANRLKVTRNKLANVKVLRAAAGKHRTQSLFFTNLLPSMAYGADVTGLTPTELRARESLALSAVGPYSRGCSRTIKNAVHHGLVDHLSVAVTTRLATDIWDAAMKLSGCLPLATFFHGVESRNHCPTPAHLGDLQRTARRSQVGATEGRLAG